MRLSEGWLREWVDVQADFTEIERCLSLGGFEIEERGAVGPDAAQVVVGRITAVALHPDAERLQVCRVDVGDGVDRTIVCGAANARVDLRAPVALPGACVGGREITVSTLRGVRSEGMLCGAQELGVLAEGGLWELPTDAPPGLALTDYIGKERFLDVSVTPNRGDCLSVQGLAREVAALCGGRVRPPRNYRPRLGGEAPEASVTASSGCSHYGLCLVEMGPGHASPFWLRERLRHQRQKALGTVVDVTNYVMFDRGQPMHGFDADAVIGAVEVRWAEAGEVIMLLDGSERHLETHDLVIADQQGPLALAGIMGGMRARVTAQTVRVLLEAATFEPAVVSRTARRFGLTTDAALRFERGVDPELPLAALAQAVWLLQKAGAVRASMPRVWRLEDKAPVGEGIGLRFKRIESLLGLAMPAAETRRLLRRLGMRAVPIKGGCQVWPPSFRFDIKAEIDLIEEVARVYGYDKIPDRELPVAAGRAAATAGVFARAKRLLMDRGYNEVMTFSLVDAADQEALGFAGAVNLRNPLAGPWGSLRRSLLPGLLRVAQYNRNRQQTRLRLFELGRCYEPHGGEVREVTRLGGLILGPRYPEQWANPRDMVDFFDIKGDVEALCQILGLDLATVARPEPCLQAGQSAVLVAGEQGIGTLGALHPRERARFGFEEPVYVFELVPAVHAKGVRMAEPPRFPAIRRDLALVVRAQVAAADILKTTREAAGPLLRELVLFDVYQGEGLDFGKKSLALGLTLQDFSRTLNDEVVEDVMARTLSALETAYGARLRQRS
ncbi:MAG: phenylalanine--tRNA ligase subunit beta [Gammaproteobacteria bacterium]|nr:phenylalanine--tRNA ligase subunit beta [Gammaproteobacteria bacterium]